MADKRPPMNVYTVLLAGAALMAMAALVAVLVRSGQLIDDSPLALFTGKSN